VDNLKFPDPNVVWKNISFMMDNITKESRGDYYVDSEHKIECPACVAGFSIIKKNLYTVITTKRIRPTYKELISKHRRR
jgi:hypothetical protein